MACEFVRVTLASLTIVVISDFFMEKEHRVQALAFCATLKIDNNLITKHTAIHYIVGFSQLNIFQFFTNLHSRHFIEIPHRICIVGEI